MTININSFCPLDEYIPWTRVNGQDWFVAENIRRALQDQRGRTNFGGKREGIVPIYPDEDDASLVSEEDFYRWVLGSENVAAQRFRSWVMTVVMPTVIEDGLYMFGEEGCYPTPSCEDEDLLLWKDDSVLDDEALLMELIGWWDRVIEILKWIRRSGEYMIYPCSMSNEIKTRHLYETTLRTMVTMKIERRDRPKRAAA